MGFTRVKMFKGESKKEYSGQTKKVYDYNHPLEAVAKKHTLFILLVIVFLISLLSYGLDLGFKSGRNVFAYGYCLISIPFIIVSMVLLVSSYRHKNTPGNYPLDKISKWHAKGCPLSIIISSVIIGILFILRLLLTILILINNQMAVNGSPLWLSLIQTGLYLSSFIIIVVVVLGHHKLNKNELKIVEKPIEECNYIVHDLIRNFSPYSWMIIGALIIMMFVATLLI